MHFFKMRISEKRNNPIREMRWYSTTGGRGRPLSSVRHGSRIAAIARTAPATFSRLAREEHPRRCDATKQTHYARTNAEVIWRNEAK